MKGVYAIAFGLKVSSYLVSTVYQLIKVRVFDLRTLQEKDFVCLKRPFLVLLKESQKCLLFVLGLYVWPQFPIKYLHFRDKNC